MLKNILSHISGIDCAYRLLLECKFYFSKLHIFILFETAHLFHVSEKDINDVVAFGPIIRIT